MSRWIDQTTFYDPENPKSGNCAQAAVASILGLPLEDVPDFKDIADNDSYKFWASFEEFLLECGFWTIRKDGSNYVPEGLYLACGPSARGCGHMVVMEEGALVHDPHFSKEGIKDIEHIWILVPKDPAQFQNRGKHE